MIITEMMTRLSPSQDKSEEEGMTMGAGKNLSNTHEKMEKKSRVRNFSGTGTCTAYWG